MVLVFFDIYFCSSSLLKTFSIIPFHGQYPMRAVTINITPINPTIHREIPSIEKAKMTKITPMIVRKTASILPIFFVWIIGSILSPLFYPFPCFTFSLFYLASEVQNTRTWSTPHRVFAGSAAAAESKSPRRQDRFSDKSFQ